MNLRGQKWLIGLVIFAVVIGGVFAVRVRPVLVGGRELSERFVEKVNEKSDFLSRPEGPPTEKLIKETREENEMLLAGYWEGIEELNMVKPGLLPEDTARPSIYWLDTLRRTRRELSAAARRAGIDIPKGLSFGDEIPSDDQVPELLRRLKIIEEVLTLAVRSKLKSVTGVSLGTEEVIPSSGGAFLKRLPLYFSVTGDLESLVLFMHSLQETDSFYIVEDISVENEEQVLKANLSVSTLCLQDES